MPVSGLVVSLKHNQQLREEAIAEIRAEPFIETGAIESGRMAIVIDTPTADEDKRLWCWLGSLPGVVFVDVAFVGMDSEGSSEPSLDSQPRPTRAKTHGC